MKLVHATVACLAGAGLAWFAATRVWSVEVITRPGLSDLRTPTTGVEAQPWLLALVLIALAGAGALLATRGGVRRGLGALFVVVGAGLAVAAVTGRMSLDAGDAGAGAVVWPAVCVFGAALIALAGLGAARHGASWPVMGARYERPQVPLPTDGPVAGSGPHPAAGRSGDTIPPPPAARPGTAPTRTTGSGGPPAEADLGDHPNADRPNTGHPNADRPNTGHPNTDRPNTGHPNADRPNTGHPNTGHPNTDHPNADQPSTDQPGSDGVRRGARTGTAAENRAFWEALDRGDDPTDRD